MKRRAWYVLSSNDGAYTGPVIDYQAAVKAIEHMLIENKAPLLRLYGRISFSSKADGSPVIELDVRVGQLLQKRLQGIAPGIGFYAEEIAHDTMTATSWLVDLHPK